MADEKQSKESKEQPEAAAPEAAKAETGIRYPRERLIEESVELIGHPKHVAAGALKDADDELTARQAQQKAEKYLNRVVKEA